MASQLQSQGKQTSLGTDIAAQYGLTADQYAQLAAVTADWSSKFAPVDAKAKPLLAQGLTSVTSPDLDNLVEAHRQVTRDTIARLQTALGGYRDHHKVPCGCRFPQQMQIKSGNLWVNYGPVNTLGMDIDANTITSYRAGQSSGPRNYWN